MSPNVPRPRGRASSSSAPEWQRRADALQFDALPAVRASAERWAAALGGLLGAASLAALLRGPDAFKPLAGHWETAAEILFAAAGVAALLATGLATVAATAGGAQLKLATGHALYRLHRQRFRRAARAFMWSRVLALVAVVALVGAAGILWVAPQEAPREPARVQVTLDGGATLCGPLIADGRRLVLRGGAGPTVIPFGTVRAIRGIERCPAS